MYWGGVAAIALTVAGCGGSNSAKSAAKTGVFIDSVVAGASYSSMPSGLKGKTNAKGEFKYKEGDYVSFAVGAIKLGSAKAASKVYIRNVRPEGISVPNTTSTIRMSQFLLTMDTDGDPTNGIQIDTKKETDFPNVDFITRRVKLDLNTAALQAWAEGKKGHKAADIPTTIAHLEKNMPNKSLEPDTFKLKPVNGAVDCAAPNEFVGGEKGLQVTRKLSQDNALKFIKGRTFKVGRACRDKVEVQEVVFDKTGQAINFKSGKVDFTAAQIKQAFSPKGIPDTCGKAGACTVRLSVYHGIIFSNLVSEETIKSTGETNRYSWNTPLDYARGMSEE